MTQASAKPSNNFYFEENTVFSKIIARITTIAHPIKLNHKYGISVKEKKNKTRISAIIAARNTELPPTLLM